MSDVTPPGGGDDVPRRRSRRGWWSRVMWVGLGLIVVWAGLSAWVGIRAYRLANAALGEAHGLGAVATPAALLDAPSRLGPLASQVAHLGRDVGEAHRDLASPLLWPLRALPVVGRQLAVARALTRTTSQVADAADGVLEAAPGALRFGRGASPSGGSPTVGSAVGSAGIGSSSVGSSSVGSSRSGGLVAFQPTVRQLGAAVCRLETAVQRADLGPAGGVLGPLRAAQARVGRLVLRMRGPLARACGALAGLGALLEGDHRVLLLGASPAESRVGMGSLLVAAPAQIAAGRLSVGAPVATPSMPPPRRSVALPSGLAARFGWTEPGRNIDALGLDPDFPVDAKVAAEIWAADGHRPVGTVVAIDPVAISALLAGTGPVEDAGIEIDSANVVAYLDQGQYAGLPPGGGTGPEATLADVRLADLTGTVLRRLEAGQLDLARVWAPLAAAAAGRHLLVWSASAAEERDWVAAGVSGRVGPDDVMVGLANLGANKLDPLTTVEVHATLLPGRAETEDLQLVVRVHDGGTTRPSLVDGPAPGLGNPPGAYIGTLVVTVPEWARSLSCPTVRSAEASGREERSLVLAVGVDLEAGRSGSWVFDVVLPSAARSVEILPSARVPPEEWSLTEGGRTVQFSDQTEHTIAW